MSFICDFHIHSKYSRATSKDMNVDNLSLWARLKGIDLLGTGDFTHPAWLKELKEKLRQEEYGLYKHANTYFMLTAEVSNIYFKTGKTHKVHNIIFAPSFEIAEEINKMLAQFGDLYSDGRPILSLESDKLVKNLSKINEDIFVVPAHVWTPWFSLFGANSGFESIEECFEAETPKIYALETGLSSDPPMNWRWSELDRFSLISNSDAHSSKNIGREANVFASKIGYKELIEILKNKDKNKFLYTIEFYPQEGKYHWDGHRNCNVRLAPAEARNLGCRCPACGKKITIGVMHRVEKLGDRKEGFVLENAHPFKNLVPLAEIIALSLGVGTDTVSVHKEYNNLINLFGSELKLLLDVPDERVKKECSSKIAKGILNMRKGNVEIVPGYDGVYGKVNVFKEGEEPAEKQLELF